MRASPTGCRRSGPRRVPTARSARPFWGGGGKGSAALGLRPAPAALCAPPGPPSRRCVLGRGGDPGDPRRPAAPPPGAPAGQARPVRPKTAGRAPPRRAGASLQRRPRRGPERVSRGLRCAQPPAPYGPRRQGNPAQASPLPGTDPRGLLNKTAPRPGNPLAPHAGPSLCHPPGPRPPRVRGRSQCPGRLPVQQRAPSWPGLLRPLGRAGIRLQPTFLTIPEPQSWGIWVLFRVAPEAST